MIRNQLSHVSVRLDESCYVDRFQPETPAVRNQTTTTTAVALLLLDYQLLRTKKKPLLYLSSKTSKTPLSARCASWNNTARIHTAAVAIHRICVAHQLTIFKKQNKTVTSTTHTTHVKLCTEYSSICFRKSPSRLSICSFKSVQHNSKMCLINICSIGPWLAAYPKHYRLVHYQRHHRRWVVLNKRILSYDVTHHCTSN